jgi:16S rRNA (adenine1518-N6/adenine1519-N6)-dimethyltransferase
MHPSEVRAILTRIGVSPTKERGQNFLLDERVADREIAYLNIEPGETALEVGPGLGMLTERLLPVAKVFCIELDRRICGYLKERFDGRIELAEADALRAPFPAFDRFISNVPYSISSPLIFRLLTYRFKRAVLMVQKEFADRMTAAPGSDDYSRLTVMTYYRARCEVLEQVPRSRFWPEPEVDSTVISLEPRPAPFPVEDEAFYIRLVEILFQSRRKKIRTILRNQRLITQEQSLWLPHMDDRVEVLSPEQIGLLAEAIRLSKGEQEASERKTN